MGKTAENRQNPRIYPFRIEADIRIGEPGSNGRHRPVSPAQPTNPHIWERPNFTILNSLFIIRQSP